MRLQSTKKITHTLAALAPSSLALMPPQLALLVSYQATEYKKMTHTLVALAPSSLALLVRYQATEYRYKKEDSYLGGLGPQQPSPDEAGPGAGAEYVHLDGEAGHIVLQLLAQMVMLRGIVYQDNLLNQLQRGPETKSFKTRDLKLNLFLVLIKISTLCWGDESLYRTGVHVPAPYSVLDQHLGRCGSLPGDVALCREMWLSPAGRCGSLL
jgi:hypothetical protein